MLVLVVVVVGGDGDGDCVSFDGGLSSVDTHMTGREREKDW